MPLFEILFYLVPAIALVSILILSYSIVSPWRRAFLSGGKVSIFQIVMTGARHNPINLIMDAYLSLVNSGFETTYANVERHYIVYKSRIITSADLVLSVREDSLET